MHVGVLDMYSSTFVLKTLLLVNVGICTSHLQLLTWIVVILEMDIMEQEIAPSRAIIRILALYIL